MWRGIQKCLAKYIRNIHQLVPFNSLDASSNTERPEIVYIAEINLVRDLSIFPRDPTDGVLPSTILASAKQTTIRHDMTSVSIGFQIDFSLIDKISCQTNEVTKKGCRRDGSCSSGIRLPNPIYPPTTPAWKKERERGLGLAHRRRHWKRPNNELGQLYVYWCSIEGARREQLLWFSRPFFLLPRMSRFHYYSVPHHQIALLI